MFNFYKTNSATINKYLDFEYIEEETELLFLKTPDGLIEARDQNISLTIEESEKELIEFGKTDSDENIFFEKVNGFEPIIRQIKTDAKIEIYINFLVLLNISLFEEIYIHEDLIDRNIKKIEYLKKMQETLTYKKEK